MVSQADGGSDLGYFPLTRRIEKVEDLGVVYGQTKDGDATAGGDLPLSPGKIQRLQRPEKEAREMAQKTHVVEEN